MNQLSPLCHFPNDVLRYAFCQGAPTNVKQLIILSLVCKQFNLCFNDFSLWRQFADKHSITNCTTGAQVKQALIDIARREFNPEQSSHLSSFHEVHTRLTYCERPLSGMESSERFVEPSGSKLPITYKNKTYSAEEVLDGASHFLRIKNKNSGMILESIRLNSDVSFSLTCDRQIQNNNYLQPYPTNQDCDVQLNDDVLVYHYPTYPHLNSLVMLFLDHNHDRARFASAFNYSIYEGQDPIKWELFRGGLTYTICKRLEHFDFDNDIEQIYDVDETKYVNFALMPLVKALNLLKMIDQDQICLLREFVSSTAKVPFNFFCPISSEIMSNPVRDRCVGEEGGHLCDKGTFLQSLAEGQALPNPPKLGREVAAQCPFSTQMMPSIVRECKSIREVIEEETVIVDGEEDITVPTKKFIPCFTLNTNGGFTHDLQLQGEILAWLQTQVFEVEFNKWPDAKKNAFYEQLYHIMKPANPYWGIAEDAFLGRNGQRATMEQKIAALHNMHNNSSTHFFEDRMKSFMLAFSQLPNSFKEEVYGHLQGGEDAFHGRNGQSSTREEKMEALRRCIHAAEIDALEWMF